MKRGRPNEITRLSRAGLLAAWLDAEAADVSELQFCKTYKPRWSSIAQCEAIRKGEASVDKPDHQWRGTSAVLSQLQAARRLAESDEDFRETVELIRSAVLMGLLPKASV